MSVLGAYELQQLGIQYITFCITTCDRKHQTLISSEVETTETEQTFEYDSELLALLSQPTSASFPQAFDQTA